MAHVSDQLIRVGSDDSGHQLRRGAIRILCAFSDAQDKSLTVQIPGTVLRSLAQLVIELFEPLIQKSHFLFKGCLALL